MKKVLLGIIVLLLLTSLGYCQNQPLQLTIKSDKQVYEVREEIKLEATIKNNSDKEMIVFWNNAKPTLVSDKFNVVTASLSTFPVENAETMYIKPKDIISKHISIDNTLEPRSVKYQLTLQYDVSSVPVDFLLSLNQKVFTGVLISNTITIEVVEKKLSKEAIITIAKNIPYNLEKLEAIYDEGNQMWNREWEKRRNHSKNLPEIWPPLIGKNYQAIYFSPKKEKGLPAAGVWVFVDRDTGKIIEFQEEAN